MGHCAVLIATPDEAFAKLRLRRKPRPGSVLREVRRRGDEAVLLYRWPPFVKLYGVPVSLLLDSDAGRWQPENSPGGSWGETGTWEPPADLDAWAASIELWKMDTVENYFNFRARRRLVEDYIELRGPDWARDPRFEMSELGPTDGYGWTRVPYVVEAGLDPSAALTARDRGTLVAWVTGSAPYAPGYPYVSQAAAVWEEPGVARLEQLEVVPDAPATLLLATVRHLTHLAAESGAIHVVADFEFPHHDIAGFRPEAGRLVVDTMFIDEQPERADQLVRDALAHPGRWWLPLTLPRVGPRPGWTRLVGG